MQGREVHRQGGRGPGRHQALTGYLAAADRANVLGTERPLSSRAFVENLKGYDREAGIPHIHLHQTRHTYARIVAEETGSFLEAQEALDHENAATTRVYVQRIIVKRDRHGRGVALRMELGRGAG